MALDALTAFLLYVQLGHHFASGLNITFSPPSVELYVDDLLQVDVLFLGTQEDGLDVLSSNWKTVSEPEYVLHSRFLNGSLWCEEDRRECNGTVLVEGHFLGFGNLSVERQDQGTMGWTRVGPSLDVTVLRQERLINKLFTAFVATVIIISYINMGCALDLDAVKQVLKRPIGPAVGFACQFGVMPLVSYGVGLLLFDDPVLRLGLFTFGSSPGGGASNMWTILLGGNLNLSITMTFISTIAALATLPMWLFTLGTTILEGTNIVIPFQNILISLITLTVPIGIGIFIQKRWPKMAARSKRILAPMCIILLILIIALAAWANAYMFYMLTWRMAIAASLSVWAGFAAGVLVSLAFRLKCDDVITIAVETGIQNSGIAFVLLSYSLKAPVSDIAAVVPVAGSIITPIPLFAVYLFQKIRKCYFKSENFELKEINSKPNDTDKGVDNAAHEDVKY